jgi:hypothetical protein
MSYPDFVIPGFYIHARLMGRRPLIQGWPVTHYVHKRDFAVKTKSRIIDDT